MLLKLATLTVALALAMGSPLNLHDEADQRVNRAINDVKAHQSFQAMTDEQKLNYIEKLLEEAYSDANKQEAVAGDAEEREVYVPQPHPSEIRGLDLTDEVKAEIRERYHELYHEGVRHQQARQLIAREMGNEPATVQNTPSKRHYRRMAPSENFRVRGLAAELHLRALQQLKEEFVDKRQFDFTQVTEFSTQADVFPFGVEHIFIFPDEDLPSVDGVCFETKRLCDPFTPFRTHDGSCNNLIEGRENWGAAGFPFRRRLNPLYADGISDPRRSQTNRGLPNARTVSRTLTRFSGILGNEELSFSRTNTMHTFQIGQLLDHDFTSSPTFSSDDVPDSICDCNSDIRIYRDVRTRVDIPNNEAANHSLDCFPMRRSLPISTDWCSSTQRQQGNSLSSWVDASHLYGNNLTRNIDILRFPADRLLVNQNNREQGQMIQRQNPFNQPFDSTVVPFRDILMPPDDSCTLTTVNNNGATVPGACEFVTGDSRANEQPGLASAHTLFVRIHNRFERLIAEANPGLDAEFYYQHARRFVVAIWQSIVFNEFSRVILGDTAHAFHKLGPVDSAYNPDLDARLDQGFSVAAFRLGHTYIPNELPYQNRDLVTPAVNITLSDQFEANSPENLYTSPVTGQGGINSLMVGMSNQRGQAFDSFVVPSIQDFLFREDPAPGQETPNGFDLVALNIQRGREHGIPGYGVYYQDCLKEQPSFANFRPSLQSRLRSLYGRNNDSDLSILNNIDLFPAGISEELTADGQLGPVFTCLVGDMLNRVKNGDRFYYMFPDAGFTTAQKRAINDYTLSELLCDTVPELANPAGVAAGPGIQPNAFYFPSSDQYFFRGELVSNERRGCGRIRQFTSQPELFEIPVDFPDNINLETND